MRVRIRQPPSKQTGCVCLCGKCDNLTNVRYPLISAHNRGKCDDVRQWGLSNSSPFIRRVRAKVVFFMHWRCRLGQLVDSLWACTMYNNINLNPRRATRKVTHIRNSEADSLFRRFLLRGHFAHCAGVRCFPKWIKHIYALHTCGGATVKVSRDCVCIATWLIRGQRTRAR